MKKIIIPFLSIFLSLYLSGCSETTPLLDEQYCSDSSTEIIEEETLLQKHSKNTNIPMLDSFLNDMYYENGSLYTIDLQRQIKDKAFLMSSYYFDIAEQNNKIYLKENCYSYVLLIELSEKQLEEIKSYKDVGEIIYSFDVKDIYPIDSYFYPENDIDTSYDEMIYTDEINDYIYPYMEIAVDKQVILGKCKDIYEITLEE
jgi:predicted nucleic acid-binding Zn ribbon protein